MNLKRYVPWWAKVSIKVILWRMPMRYRFWQRLDLFVHGQMDRPEYALRVVREHLARAGWSDFRDRVVVELGPGDSLATALIAKALGARKTILVDAGPYASRDVGFYREMARLLRDEGLPPPEIDSCGTLDEILARCNAEYRTGGLADLRAVAASSADMVFSQAVLEHIEGGELEPTIHEMHRVLRVGGVTSHQVDLRDHLGGALNHLRFSNQVWEAPWMARSGFYTNRVRFREMLAMFARAGFAYEVTDERRWEKLPTARAHLAPMFRDVPDEDLRVSQFDIVARRTGQAGGRRDATTAPAVP